MMGPRAILMKTSQCAAKAAEIYPRVVRLMDEANVPFLDRELVCMMLAEAVGEEEPDPLVIN